MKKVFLYVIIVAVVGVAAFFAWKFYSKVKVENIEAFDAIPDNAAFILKFSNAMDFLNSKLQNTNNALTPFQQMDNASFFVHQIDSILQELEKNELVLHQYVMESEMYYSVHMNGVDKFNSLYTFKLTPPVDIDMIQTSFEKLGRLKVREFEGEEIWELKLKDSKEVLHLTNKGNLILISQIPILIEKVIYTLNKDVAPTEDPLIKKLQKIEGQDNALTLYINYKFFYRFLGKYGDPIYRDMLKKIDDLARYAVLDVSVEESLLRLNGFSIASDSSNSFTNLIRKLPSGTFYADKVLPYNTAGFFYFGSKNYKEYFESIASNSWEFRQEAELAKIKDQIGKEVAHHFYPWMKDELIICYGKGNIDNLAENTYAFMRVTDIKEANQSLADLSNAFFQNLNSTPDSLFYRNYQIHHIPHPYLLSKLFGTLFEGLANTYYVAIEDYIVFGNSASALQKYLNDYMVGKNLSEHPNYQSIAENISRDAHLMCYLDASVYRNIWSSFLSVATTQDFESQNFPVQSLGAFIFEIQSENTASYTNVLLSLTSGEDQVEESVGWQTALDANVSWGPFEVKNHVTGQQDILVADIHNFLYRIDHTGQIAWKIPLIGNPLGDVASIDFYQNNKYQYLFNTSSFIYVLDVNGNKVENYPIKLPQTATAGLSMISYKGSDKVRILLPLADNKVYNFTLNGDYTEGWKYPSLGAPIYQKIQYFNLDGKDIILIADTSGNVMYANRRGENRIQTKLGFTNSTTSDFYQVNHKGENKLLTTDPLGRVVMINFKGEVSKLLLSEFTAKHQFNYFDFDNNGVKDYVFIDYQKFQVFNQNKEKIFEKELGFLLSESGLELEIHDDSLMCILRNSENSQLYLLKSNGNMSENEGYSSSGKFFIRKATKSTKLRLITVNGNVISNYIL